MDLLAHIAAVRAHLDEIEALHRHQVEHWTGLVRTPPESVPPSQLPDRALGPVLARVRGYLCRAPGRPVDPEFDRVVTALGLEWARARARAEAMAKDGLAEDGVWLGLRDAAGAAAARVERGE